MKNKWNFLIYVGAVFLIFWGVAHEINTASVVNNFGVISQDNRLVITMEWINEGAILIFLGLLSLLISFFESSKTTKAVYWSIFAMLQALSVISLFTGFRINFLPYQLCVPIFEVSAILILIGGLLKK